MSQRTDAQKKRRVNHHEDTKETKSQKNISCDFVIFVTSWFCL